MTGRLTPSQRKLVLTIHVGTSVGWLGAAVAMSVLAVIGRTVEDPHLRHSAYMFMHFFDQAIMIPFSLLAFFSGIALSLWTNWGLFDHYWVITKFVLTTAVILFAAIQTSLWVHNAIELAMAGGAEFDQIAVRLLINSACNLLSFWAMTALSVYKPWGRTGRGERQARQRAESARLRTAD